MPAVDAPRDPAGEVWKLAAACRDADVDLWFPERTGRPQDAKRVVAAAKKVCATCPVADACLTYAIEHHENWGIWGGTTPTERRPSRRQAGGPRRWKCHLCGEWFVSAANRLYCSTGCREEASRRVGREHMRRVRST